MTFRTKLMAFFVATIVTAVTLVAWGVSVYTRRAFEEFDRQRTDALVAQFRREYAQRGDEIAHRVQSIADSEATLRMAMDLNRPQADASQYYNDARGIAQSQQLDFVDLVADDSSLISSSEWPARFGYKNDWVTSEPDWNSKGAFLRRVDTPDAVDVGLLAVRTVRVGQKRLFLIGGQRLDQNFLGTLVLPEGMRTLLYRNLEMGFEPAELTDQRGPASQPELFSSMITEVQGNRRDLQRTITSGAGASARSETFNAIPLVGRDDDLLGVLLVGSSRENLIQMLNFIRALSLLVGGGVILLGFILGWWISARVTRPIEKLAAGARDVAAGHWEARVEVHSRDEIGQLANTFNEMTRQLADQRERLVQTERVAAWRELARRLAHELRNPLFPLQITVENLQRARQLDAKQFLEVFTESTATLKAELTNLNSIVGRFGDFSKMPAPQFAKVDVNEALRNIIRLFEPQFNVVGKPVITPEYFLTEPLPEIDADAVLLHRAFQNLVLNAVDVMPSGGTLTLRTSEHSGNIRIEISDTGSGLTSEECSRLFTPYYTTKNHGTGLGLAIVQSVISDHHGTISVSSEEGHGTTFHIELPQHQTQPLAARSEDAAPPPKKAPSPSTLAAASD